MSWAKMTGTKEHRCPNCGSEALRRSQMRGLIERGVLRVIGIRAFRCESCDQRHYGFEGKEGNQNKSRR